MVGVAALVNVQVRSCLQRYELAREGRPLIARVEQIHRQPLRRFNRGRHEPRVSGIRGFHERRQVRAALALLKRREASLLALRYGGASYREIAETLGIAPTSVGTLLRRAEAAFERAYRAVTADCEGRRAG